MPEAPSDDRYDSPDDFFAAREIEMPIGIVVEKRPAVSRWISHVWMPVAVLPGAGPLSEWKLLIDDGSVQTYHIATLPLTLHRKETEAYLVNLAGEAPAIYVVLRNAEIEDDPDAPEIKAVAVTASPYSAQDFSDCAEDMVEAVPMPDGLIAWVQEFIDHHHTETPFKKRKRTPHVAEEASFGKELHPIEQRFYDKTKLN
ncbi:MAG: DUF3305 domain-containing protein [Alphaproteobacteria bacterium]|nr:DUF3305 domain-containing protein [Alphaproteobacteria bacterium]